MVGLRNNVPMVSQFAGPISTVNRLRVLPDGCGSQNKTQSHVLNALSRLNQDVDKRHERRALSDTDFGLLLATAKNSTRIDKGDSWEFTGTDRYHLYLFASLTGLRASECASVQVQNFDWENGVLPVKARDTKNKNHATIHLHPVLQQLREYMEVKQLTGHVWSGDWANKKWVRS